MSVDVRHGDCLEVIRTLPDDSVHAVVTDPPYGLGFMGKAWDDLPPGREWAEECLRVLKPGGHLLAFGGTRTFHRLAVAVEDAGFEIRDSIAWLYGSGFPKSLDVGKAIDKAAGATREVIGPGPWNHVKGAKGRAGGMTPDGYVSHGGTRHDETAPATDAARQWSGWGTALKPAFEPIVVARKPLAGTVASNIQAWGTGAINVDACRVAGAKPNTTRGASINASSMAGPLGGQGRIVDDGRGRWPANVVLDGTQADALDEQSGTLTSGARRTGGQGRTDTADWRFTGGTSEADSGGASRFFPVFRYQAKAPTRERPKVDGVAHATVKPLELMRWLVRLVTPLGGTVLDPFAGSGTTVEACILEGFNCIAIEREAEYLPLIQARIDRHAGTLDWGASA